MLPWPPTHSPPSSSAAVRGTDTWGPGGSPRALVPTALIHPSPCQHGPGCRPGATRARQRGEHEPHPRPSRPAAPDRSRRSRWVGSRLRLAPTSDGLAQVTLGQDAEPVGAHGARSACWHLSALRASDGAVSWDPPLSPPKAQLTRVVEVELALQSFGLLLCGEHAVEAVLAQDDHLLLVVVHLVLPQQLHDLGTHGRLRERGVVRGDGGGQGREPPRRPADETPAGGARRRQLGRWLGGRGEDAPARREAGVPFLWRGRGDGGVPSTSSSTQPLPKPLLKGAVNLPCLLVTQLGHAEGGPGAAPGTRGRHSATSPRPGRSDTTAQSPAAGGKAEAGFARFWGGPGARPPPRARHPQGTAGGPFTETLPPWSRGARKQSPASSCRTAKSTFM